MALTHFEPLDARSAFPCFDEPAMKARFVVKLTVPVAYQAAANMPAVKEELSIDQKQKVCFTIYATGLINAATLRR